VVLLGYLAYQILHPFLKAIAWAVVLSIIFYPVYVFLLRIFRFKTISATVTLLLIILIILGPFTYLSFVLVDEVKNVVESINSGKFDSIRDIFTNLKIVSVFDKFATYLGIESIDIGDIVTRNIKNLGNAIANNISTGIANIAQIIINFIFTLFTVFFFLKDGPGFLSRVKDYLPFTEEDKKSLISKIKDMIVSTVYGGVVVALIQGALGGTAFYFLGITSPVLWGAAISIMSFLPLLGTFSIWGPMSGYLFIQGNYGKGIILFLFGFLIISMVDNILKPIIISGRTKMPTLAVFFSVIGGIKLFGIIGFIMGPLVLALFVSVFEIFKHVEGGENA